MLAHASEPVEGFRLPCKKDVAPKRLRRLFLLLRVSEIDLSIVIPALDEGRNLALLLPQLQKVLEALDARTEIIIVTQRPDPTTVEAAAGVRARVVEQRERGYGGALITGFATAKGSHVLTMDADLSHPPTFVHELWKRRHGGEITIASRYVAGGRAEMPPVRYVLSRTLNALFNRGLTVGVRDLSSGFRLYQMSTMRDQSYHGRDFDILQEIVVRALAEGWSVQEVPFAYAPRRHGNSHARVFRFGRAYLRRFWSLWNLRNSILAADYDDRAYDSLIWLQRYWQRRRFQHVTELIANEGPVLDVGCGSSRIIGVLPPGSVAVDILLRKLRYARRFGRSLVQASGFHLPFADQSFSCVLCSEVIEHVPKDSPILDELVRVLRPGGRLVLGTPDYGNWQWVFWIEKAYAIAAPGGYAHEHIAHYTYQELMEIVPRRGLTFETARYILRGELIMAFRKNSEGQCSR
jgi:dolichol-phosphate mannosyltransferase